MNIRKRQERARRKAKSNRLYRMGVPQSGSKFRCAGFAQPPCAPDVLSPWI